NEDRDAQRRRARTYPARADRVELGGRRPQRRRRAPRPEPDDSQSPDAQAGHYAPPLMAASAALAEAAHLGQIAAGLPIAPLTAVVFADVQKQPAAVFSGTTAQARQVIGRQHLGGRIGDSPEHPIQRGLRVYPHPGELFLADAKPDSAVRDVQLLV